MRKLKWGEHMKCALEIKKLMGHAKDGKIGKIHVQAGDLVQAGTVICTIESSKGSAKLLSDYDGKVLDITVSEGDTVKIGDQIGVVESDAKAPQNKTPQNKATKKPAAGYSFGLAKPKKMEICAEVAVVGGGPGGYVAAIRAAQLGKKVVLIEEDQLGGTCLNYGCIPTKALAHTSEVLNQISASAALGIQVGEAKLEIENIMARKSEVVQTLVGGVEHLMEVNEIELIRGTAKAISKNTLSVKTSKVDATVKFKKMILATGSEPVIIPIPGADLEGVITSRELLEIDRIPKKMAIIGGGVIGMEFAFIFASFGTQVTVVEFQNDILSMLEPEAVEVILESARESGIEIHTGAAAKRVVNTTDGTLILEFEKAGEIQYVSCERVLLATGRKPRLDSIDLEKLDVCLNASKKGVEVNGFMQTSNPDVYAIGDLTNIIQLAHVASHQGMVASEHICGIEHEMSYDAVPSAIFTHPEIGSVGMTEACARAQGIPCETGLFPFAANGKALAMDETKGFVKLVRNSETGVLIGGTIIGPRATDMLSTLVHLMDEKVVLKEALHTIYAHPTASEGIHEALLALEGRMIHFG